MLGWPFNERMLLDIVHLTKIRQRDLLFFCKNIFLAHKTGTILLCEAGGCDVQRAEIEPLGLCVYFCVI